ncbi:acyl-CoA synthetase [Haloarcula marina]|uniref:acyl-CoA synthetase n=1 Tax=Haloarcula marina TaxID=2961574 RepID=UPI0020B66565|nr:AMP-binding protein [Halomicroarcula marina]
MTWTGYDLPSDPDSYEDLRDGFAWRVPATYNLADHALSGPADRLALSHVPEGAVDAPDRTRTLTYGDLDSASATLAARLAESGVGRGDRVAVCLPQCPELVVAHLAVLRLGGVVVPVSMLVGDDSFAHLLAHSDATALIVDAVRWESAEDGLPGPSTVLSVTVDSGNDALGGLAAHTENVEAPADPPMVATSPSDPAMILYTSGSTSDPKGVLQSHQYLLGSLPGYHCWFGLFDEAAARRARAWTPSEWAWAGALFDVVFPTLAVGGTVVSSVRRRGFDAERALTLAEAQGVTHAFLPPTALRTIRNEADPAPTAVPDLEAVMCGGEPLPAAVSSWAEATLGVTVSESYGQTEANALVGEVAGVYRTDEALGRAYPGHDIVLVDDDGAAVPTGETGEIAVVCPDPVVMREYVGDPAATDAVLSDEFLRTGDLGRFDDDGTLTHLGRKDSVIITSGYRVSPLEVEGVLSDHPAVAAVRVEGEPDPERGQRVVAFVVPAADATATDDLAAALRSTVADHLGPHKRPRRIAFVEELPTTRTGKTDRSGALDDGEGA